MKPIKILLCFFIFSFTFSIAKAQDVNASTLKLGSLYLEMNLKEVEKVTGQKISIKEVIKSDENYYYNVKVIFQGIVLELGFNKIYNENATATNEFWVSRLKSSDSKLKTKSGITIGMKRSQIFEILDKQGTAYQYNKMPAYDKEGLPTNVLEESLNILDIKANRSLILLMQNGKVVGFQLGYGHSDGC